MTVRIDPDLLAALKVRAEKDGRSVSGEVVQLIRQYVTVRPKKRMPIRSSAGMFSHLGDAPSIEEFRELRTLNSQKIGAFDP
jgi:plasmid stability protein